VGSKIASVTLLGQFVGFVEPQETPLKLPLVTKLLLDWQNETSMHSSNMHPLLKTAPFPKYSVNQVGQTLSLTSTVHSHFVLMQLPPGTKVSPFAARMLEERATAIMEDDANFMFVFL